MAVLGRLAQIMVVHVDHPDTSYMVSIVVLVSYMCFGVSDRLVKTYRLCYLSFYELALAISLFMLGNVFIADISMTAYIYNIVRSDSGDTRGSEG